MLTAAIEPAGYEEWLERQGTTALYIYALLIVILVPGFHFVLTSLPGVGPDSLGVRLVAAGISLGLALAVFVYPPLRRHAYRLQVLSVLPTYIVVMMLIVDSHNQFMYLASGLLVVVGCQYAFFRVRDLVFTLAVGFLFQVAYSSYRGLGADATNHVALVMYASAIFVTLLPAYFRMRAHRSVIIARLEAQASRSELQRQLVPEQLVLQISDFVRSSFDLQEILAKVARALGTETGCHRLAIALWNDGDESMMFRSEYRRDERMPTLIGIEIKARQWQHIYRVLLSGQSIHVPDIDTYRLTTRQRRLLHMTATQELAAVPILNRQQNRLLGMITMGSGQQVNCLTSVEISLCEAIASQVAIAIQQSQVYQQLQLELEHRRLQEERLSNLANRDALTGVYNRRYFMDFLRRSLELPQTDQLRGALLYCDLDRSRSSTIRPATTQAIAS